jgi:hypothetical protein
MNAINRKARERGIESLTLEEVHRLLWEINREFKHTVSSQRLVNAVPFARQTGDRRDDATIIKEQSELFEAQWTNLEAQLVLVPGKEVLARLNDALQTRGVGHLSHAAIVEHLTRNLFDARFIRLLESLSAFSGSSSMLSAA